MLVSFSLRSELELCVLSKPIWDLEESSREIMASMKLGNLGFLESLSKSTKDAEEIEFWKSVPCVRYVKWDVFINRV